MITVYDFDVTNPDELSAIIHEMSVQIRDLQIEIDGLKTRFDEFRDDLLESEEKAE